MTSLNQFGYLLKFCNRWCNMKFPFFVIAVYFVLKLAMFDFVGVLVGLENLKQIKLVESSVAYNR